MKDLLKELESNKVYLELENGKLKVLSSNEIQADLIAKLRERKEDLIAFLSENIESESVNESQDEIPNVAIKKSYPLSRGQYRIWVLSQFADSNIAYNESMTFSFKGNFHTDILEKAFIQLIDRHEILRTTFKQSDAGDVEQFVGETRLDFRIDKSMFDQKDSEIIDQSIRSEVCKPFNIEEGPLLRVVIFEIGDNEWLMTCTAHHIIIDGWSMQIMASELMTNYEKIKSGSIEAPAPLKIQFKDYANWQNERLTGQKAEEDRTFWKKHFEGEISALNLPSEKKRPAVKTYNGSSFRKNISKETVSELKSLFNQNKCTLFMGLLASVKTLIHRYTALNDIIIGLPVAAREHIDIEGQIGLYLNTIALRSSVQADDLFTDLLSQIRTTTLQAYEHQTFPFDELIEELNLSRDASRNPLFDIQVIHQNIEVGSSGNAGAIQDLKISHYEIDKASCVFDIVFNFFESHDGLLLDVHFNQDVYEVNMIEKFVGHLLNLFKSIIEYPNSPISQLEFLTKNEKQLQLDKGTGQLMEIKKEGVLDFFNETSVQYAEQPALSFSSTTMNYRELDQLSTSLAKYLIDEFNTTKGECIGVLGNRSEASIIAILGIMKAGGVYVPIDPEFSENRVQSIMADTQMKTLLTETAFLFDWSHFDGNLFALDVQMDDLPDSQTELPKINKTDLAYIIFTSGSTGKPKGVTISHGAILNTIQSQIQLFQSKELMRHLQFASHSFDASISEIFVALCSAGHLFVLSDSDKKNVGITEDFIADNQLEIATIPPTYLELMDPEKLSSLQTLVTAGDKASPEHAKTYSDQCLFINAYGPTETSICASIFRVTETNSDFVPIGKPIFNTNIYILDSNGSMMPEGAYGEIHVAGKGLASGYIGREDLNSASFVRFKETGELVYKTGDMAKWLPDGNLKFIGRVDNQVKIRGIRVELGEVESTLLKHDKVRECIVLSNSNSTNQTELTAYFTCSEENFESTIREHLNRELPSYMVPAKIIQVEAFKLNVSGKIDKQELKKLTVNSTETTYIAPNTPEERVLVSIWEEYLDTKRIGITHDFFELGGDSIKVLKIISAIKNELSIELDISDIYQLRTIENLATYCVENKEKLNTINNKRLQDFENKRQEFGRIKDRILFSSNLADKENIEDIYPISDGELGILYEINLFDQDNVYHDQIVRYNKLKNFSLDTFKKSLEFLVQKHSVLRTKYNLFDFETEVHLVFKDIDFKIGFHDVSDVNQEQAINDFLSQELQRGFNLDEFPWRIDIFHHGEEAFTFVFQALHCILDRWSGASLFNELIDCYTRLKENDAYQPDELEINYSDFVLQNYVDIESTSLNDFWKNELSDVEGLNLFSDEKVFDVYSEFLDENLKTKLGLTIGNLNSSLQNVSLLAFLCTLKVVSNRNSLVTSYITNIRMTEKDGDKLIGNFLNTIPLKFNFNDEKNWGQLLESLESKMLDLKRRETLSHSKIIDLCRSMKNSSEGIYDTMFNFVDFSNYGNQIEEATENIPEDVGTVDITGVGFLNTPLYFTINTTGKQIMAKAQVSTSFANGISAQGFVQLYFAVLEKLINDPFGLVEKLPACKDFITGAKISSSQLTKEQERNIENIDNGDVLMEFLKDTFSKVLKVYPIENTDNFFELGGNSFASLQAWNRIQRAGFGISLNEFVKAKDILELSSLVAGKKADDTLALNDVEDVFVVSGMQHEMIDVYRNDTERSGYFHISSILEFEDQNYVHENLEKALQIVIQKHHSLRSYFSEGKEMFYQHVREQLKINIDFKDFSDLNFKEQHLALKKVSEKDCKKPFSLGDKNEPLIRVKTFKISESRYCLFTSFHHAIIDGWSGTIFRKELLENYLNIQSNRLVITDPLPNTLKEHNQLCSEMEGRSESFWKERSTIWKAPQWQKKYTSNASGEDEVIVELEKSIVVSLKQTAIREKVSLKAIFLASVADTISQIEGSNCTSIGVVTTGRTKELSSPLNSIGLFWNIVPLILKENAKIEIQQIQKGILELDSNPRIELRKLKELAKSEVFYTTYNFINFNEGEEVLEEDNNHKEEHFINSDKFPYPLNFSVRVDSLKLDRITLSCTYDYRYFSHNEVNQIMNTVIQKLKEEGK